MNQKNNHPRINVGITDKKLSADYSIKFVTNNSSGAISTFLGNTRDNNLGRTVKFLEYEAYETMADMKLYEIANQPKYSYFPKYDDHMMEFNKDLINSINSFIKSLN